MGTGNSAQVHRQKGGKPSAVSRAVFTWPLRVYYEDTDFGGVVYHANYLKYLERARTEWLRQLGFEQGALRDRLGIQFVVVAVKLDYHRPARFNDQLIVSVKATSVKRASLVFSQVIWEAAADQAVVCSAEVRVACVDNVTIKPKPLPPEIVAELV